MTSHDDDLFDENVDDSAIGSKDWKKVESTVSKDGYREGLNEGKEVSLQDGFNQGFADGVTLLQAISHLRGRISASLSLGHVLKSDLDAEKVQSLENLLKEVRQLEEKYLKIDKDSAEQAVIEAEKWESKGQNTAHRLQIHNVSEPKEENVSEACAHSHEQKSEGLSTTKSGNQDGNGNSAKSGKPSEEAFKSSDTNVTASETLSEDQKHSSEDHKHIYRHAIGEELNFLISSFEAINNCK